MSAPIISGLTQEQTNNYYTYEGMLRSYAIARQKMLNLGIAISSMYTAEIQAIYTQITPNTNITVPTQSNLAGVASLNIGSQVVAIQTLVTADLATNTTANQTLMSLAGGTPNMLGTP